MIILQLIVQYHCLTDSPKLVAIVPADPFLIKNEGENFTVTATFEGFPQPNVTARLFLLDNKTCTGYTSL